MINKSLKYFDWSFFAACILLSLTGLMMIYSTGLASPGGNNLWVRQLVALGIGIGGLFFFSTLDYRFFRKNSSVLYMIGILLLVIVLFFGENIRGSRRWFDLGFINFQAAEFSKFAMLVLLAKYFQTKRPFFSKFRYVLFSFAYVLVPVALILLQPDLGSAAVHVAVWIGMLAVTNIPRRYYLYLLVIFLIVGGLVVQFGLRDYQKDRLQSFINPASDPLGRDYNVIQSVVAIGSGGFLGQGLARGLQSQLRFLPERQTDFIFASTVEELGFLGGGLVLLLLAFVLWRIFRIINQARDSFGIYLGVGIFFLILSQAVVNIGMNLGFLPVTGIVLPFLSYGGSNLVITFWLIGVVQSIGQHSAPVRFG